MFRVGNIVVDQIGLAGELLSDVDTTLTEIEKKSLLLEALPGARAERYAGQRVLRFRDQVILKAQVTYLGTPWESFKKRIQIPRAWVDAYHQALTDDLTPRFVGIYHYGEVTIFVDFDPSTYVTRKANNSAAHVSTNDLHQAQVDGVFSRVDGNDNLRTSVRFDLFADYLLGDVQEVHPYVEALDDFTVEFLDHERLPALVAVQEMYASGWPDTMQGEWAGFYLEYRLDEFLRRSGADDLIGFQKEKRRGQFDYDLIFKDRDGVAFYGDLKASSAASHESPGNDAEDIRRCLAEFGRFWYVIYEHETWRSRDEGDVPVMEWNDWRRSVGHESRNGYDPLSYAGRFKSAVRFTRALVLEVNEANYPLVLSEFAQGRQPSGAPRALKVMIDKRNIDNFLIYTRAIS